MRDRPAIDLFLVSWLILFLELACIRWFPSHVLFLTFFTNIVLLAGFVGMSIGCLTARNPKRHARLTPLWLAVAVGAGAFVNSFAGQLRPVLAVGNQSNPEVVFFGTQSASTAGSGFTLPVEAIAGGFFLLIATVLIGPGQEMGRAFNRVPGRMRAYAVNLLGSLAGIGSFAACSYLELPPVVWFAVAAVGVGWLALRPDPDAPPETPGVPRQSPILPVACLAVVVFLTFLTSGFLEVPKGVQTYWSPYYRIDYSKELRGINTNLMAHQAMEPKNKPTVAVYPLPFLFQRDLHGPTGAPAWPAFKRVLVMGAGSGNDVVRALQWCGPDTRIDAVEIDPRIQKIGVADHPDRPYQDPRVRVYLNDGRNFLRNAPDGEYDLVVFALIDSLVLQSGYSNLRLESYLYTRESFRDVRRVLKPTGVCAVYNFFRHGWIVARLRDAVGAGFEEPPVVLTNPPQDAIELSTFGAGFTVLFAGSPETLAPLRQAFAASGNRYWVPGDRAIGTDTPAYFQTPKPAPLPPAELPREKVYGWEPEDWTGLRIATVEETHGAVRPATDDWPFLYVRSPEIPALTWRGIGLTLVLSALLWVLFRPPISGSGAAPEWGLMGRSFFLGAGFMLVETRAVVQMALLFGGTWVVNTVVFAAILVMSLAGTLAAGWLKPQRLQPYYIGLFAALGVGLAVPPDALLGLDKTTQVVLACAVAFAPVAFAGVIFAASFGRSTQPDRVFGANVAGALIGGLAENASVVLGFRYLLCVAAGFYLLSVLLGNRGRGPAVASSG